jgi:hypothetical protein
VDVALESATTVAPPVAVAEDTDTAVAVIRRRVWRGSWAAASTRKRAAGYKVGKQHK